MKQTVLIGLGGTGSRVVNNVARRLNENDIAINDGIVTCAVMDTNQTDNESIEKSGTAIPVIPTCDEKTIDEYLHLYANKSPKTWCPYTPAFGSETIIDGASEIRVKSRIAFMDTMETGKIFKLQNAIEKVFHNRPGTPEKIRVMLVSSLSGGTGSGMFIQTALWLRKFFETRGCKATIRGILLLPDVFIRTVENIRKNARKQLYHYGNAYAAIRELNAINKVIKGHYTPEHPIVIDGLFDSRKHGAKPVFDNAFFIDDVDAGGAAFDNIEAYEETVAQIVYMQLYAPMQNELTSVEDNLFRAFESNPEPVFGSCGTAKAEYPINDVVEYCALRASQDSIAEGWNKIDTEIDAMVDQQKKEESDGLVVTKRVSRRDEFIRLFDEKSNKSPDKIGRGERLFLAIKNDVFNEKREAAADGMEAPVTTSCKVEDFLNLLEEEISRTVTAEGGCDRIEKGCKLPDPDHPENFSDNVVKELQGVRTKEEEIVKKVLNTFDENVDELANNIIRKFIPLDISAVNQNNETSLFGLFVKKNPDGADFFVHPVAAKYLLYKLSQSIELRQKTLAVDAKRKKAEQGDVNYSFDNEKTRKVETFKEYWKQLGFFTSKSEIQHFIRKYKGFNLKNKTLCVDYEKTYLSQLVLKSLGERVKSLIKEIETLFEDFKKLNKKFDDEIDQNVERNESGLKKTLYVLSKREHKEEKYKSLGIDLAGRNEQLNKDVIIAIYGKFCATYRPNVDENKEYAEKNVITIFFEHLVDTYKRLIGKEHKKYVNLDIISAICEESDFDYAEEQAKKKNDDIFADDSERDPFKDEDESQKKKVRHERAIIACRDRLSNMASPFIKAKPDEALAVIEDVDGISCDKDNKIWMTTESGEVLYMPFQTELTFWGFHPKTAKDNPILTTALGANKVTAADEGYRRNELYCYSSIYGIKAEAIDKFNEQNGGEYYTHYSAIINSVVTNGSEVETPHIDKTWHEILPYVSASKQKQAFQTFYKAFWRAIAYGRISLDAHEKYQIAEQTTDSYGHIRYQQQPLLENDRNIGATDITRLLKALRNHPAFGTIIARQLEEEFNKDVEGMTTYVGTNIIQALVTEGDLNPVTMIVRYEGAQGYSSAIKDDLVGGLEEVLRDVASHYDMNRGDAQIEDAKIKLCHRIYEKSKMTRKKALFVEWLKEFKRLKLVVEAEGDDDTAATPEVEDII